MPLKVWVLFVSSVLITHSFGCTSIQNVFNILTVEAPHEFFNIKQSCVQIVGLTRDNLKRFINLIQFIDITKFTFDDLNTLNQPDLFAHHRFLTFIIFTTYYDPEKIVLHEDVFSGLDNLQEITLSGLNMETIPAKLFSHSPILEYIDISNNRLITLDANTFTSNSYLSWIDLQGNQFLQSDQPLNLMLAQNGTTVYLSQSYVKDFAILVPLFGNPNISTIHLESSNLKSLKLSDFAQFPNRTSRLNVRTHGSDYAFYRAHLDDHDINAKIISLNEISNHSESFRGFIYNIVPINSNLCNDCQFIDELFKSYLHDGRFYIHLAKQRVAFKFDIECYALENHYTKSFSSYCPAECECTYNPLLDKIWFYCENKNLTRMPQIQYPSQFSEITSISIDLNGNNLERIDFTNIEWKVVELISEINLNDNQLKSIDFGDAVLRNLNQIQLCNNPFWRALNNFTIYVGGIWRDISRTKCSVGVPLPINSLTYISRKSVVDLDAILEKWECK